MKVYGFLASGWTLMSIIKPESQDSVCPWAPGGGAVPTPDFPTGLKELQMLLTALFDINFHIYILKATGMLRASTIPAHKSFSVSKAWRLVESKSCFIHWS